jgi:hypothetical protein
VSQVIKISKPGINVGTATNPNDLVYSSEYNSLKYYTSGTINLTVSGTTAEGTVAHNLGYYPFFLVYTNYFASLFDTGVYNMCPGTFKGGPGFYTFVNAYAGTQNIYFRVDTNSANVTYTFRYVIFRNNLGL